MISRRGSSQKLVADLDTHELNDPAARVARQLALVGDHRGGANRR